MIRLSMDDIRDKKSSDSIFILGSGYSINGITTGEWDIIGKYDSIGFNWFCKHTFEPTFFLIREQSNVRSRRGFGETVKDFIELLNRYAQTTGIICDVSLHTKKAYRYQDDDRIKMPCIVLKDDKTLRYKKFINMKRDPSRKGLIHGTCTMYNILHFVTFLGYQNLIFAGVDLYDSRYFWLGRKETRHTVSKKYRRYKDRHAVASTTIDLIRKYQKAMRLKKMYVTNPRSLLKRVISYKPIADFL